jgi:hypothetical protein
VAQADLALRRIHLPDRAMDRPDQVALNRIDRWIGGVHLRGRHVRWRWDDGTETIVRLST